MVSYQKIEVGGPKVAVPTQKLVTGKNLPFDVYEKDNGGYKLLFTKGAAFDSAANATLTGKEISEVYISTYEQGALDRYLTAKQPEREAPSRINSIVFAEYSSNKKQYFHIERKLLVAGTKIDFNLFVMNMMVITPLLEAEEYAPGMIDKATLETKGDLLIKNADILRYHSYISSILGSAKTEAFTKAVAVKEDMKMVIKDLFDDPRSGVKIQESEHLVSKMVDCVLENPGTAKDLLDLMSFDYYTYTHSVNVAVMSIGLGGELNMGRTDIEELGLGALLHDIGKSSVPNYILNKQGKLNYSEYLLMQGHVIEGKHILEATPDVSANSISALLQHHEKLSGKGYPFQLSGNEINSFGKITAIADCFDALTTQRPYRTAYTPFHALALITKETGDYDQAFLTSFIKMLAK